jgi:hypothetical protein
MLVLALEAVVVGLRRVRAQAPGFLAKGSRGGWVQAVIGHPEPAELGLDGLIVKSVTGLMVNKLGRYKVKRFWDSDKDGLNKPTCPNAKGSVRVTLQAPEWTDGGGSKGSPGCVRERKRERALIFCARGAC